MFILCGVLLLVSCSSDKSPRGLPSSAPVIAVTMKEYQFRHQPGAPRGRVIFRVRNEGELAHQLLLVRLPDDMTGTLDAQLRSPNRRPVRALESLPVSAPGKTSVFAADLEGGRYGFVCFLKDSGEVTHALKGMSSDLRVQ